MGNSINELTAILIDKTNAGKITWKSEYPDGRRCLVTDLPDGMIAEMYFASAELQLNLRYGSDRKKFRLYYTDEDKKLLKELWELAEQSAVYADEEKANNAINILRDL